MRAARLAAVFWAFSAWLCPAAAGEFESPKGFTLQYPDGWVVATKDLQTAAFREAQEEFEGLRQVDFDRRDAFIFEPGDDGFAENINVAVGRGSVRVTEGNQEELADEVRARVRHLGMKLSGTRTSLMEIDGRTALVLRHRMGIPGVPDAVQQLVAIVPGRRHFYTVTCTAAAKDFDRYESRFLESIRSLRVDTGLRGLPPWLSGAVVGGIGGLAVGLFVLLRKRLRARSAASASGLPASPYEQPPPREGPQ